MVRRSLLHAALALVIVSLVMATLPAISVAAPRALTAAERARVDGAIGYLRDMGDTALADNVQSWLDAGKIKADQTMTANATTNRRGEIAIRADLLAALPAEVSDDRFEAWKQHAWLARLFVHEKTHAHQAPEGGAMNGGPARDTEDWDASGDVFSECRGPEATEVEAYYRLILGLLRWAKVLQERPLPDTGEFEEMRAEMSLRARQIQWLKEQSAVWARRLKQLNYEKAAAGQSIAERLAAIATAGQVSGSTEHAIKLAQIAELEQQINALFSATGAYSRVRATYTEKRGNDSASSPVGPEGTLVTFPGGGGSLRVPPAEPAQIGSGTRVTVYRFGQPPDPDAVYHSISPYFDIEWEGSSLPPEMTISFAGLDLAAHPDARVFYFAPQKGDGIDHWEPLPSEATAAGELSATTSYTAIHAVMVPNPELQPGVHRITARKTSNSGVPLDGAEFTLYLDANGDGVGQPGELVSGPQISLDGTVTFSDLAPGDYLVVETAPPPGYLPAQPAVQAVEIPLDSLGVIHHPVVQFINTKVSTTPGSITVHKTDPEGAQLDGASFALYWDVNGDGQPQPGELAAGPSPAPGGTVTFGGLWQGNYLVVESDAPSGYLPPDPNLELVSLSKIGSQVEDKTITWVNQPLPAKTVIMYIGSKAYSSNGQPRIMDVAPFVENSRTFVPVRFLAEEFDAAADWAPKDAPVEIVTLSRPDTEILITIGSTTLQVTKNGVEMVVESDVAAFIRDGRTFLPFRVIAEAFGAEVDYGPKDAPVEWVSFRQ